ncbi:restriction endonuclease subunit S [Helicobacter pylori]|uniref:restriction endonuclease subunit S n=1 Tax=Helicobacter pylori TaxID=210 RepID=UPI0023012702|nr:restriction endonuclease subunit S [Helicobacter pylori]WCB33817.1 restriction endonuclease subunit S [Helicobacter pylori]WHT45519.1 restriction endonuclease subunit S [Helicobacter pylori]
MHKIERLLQTLAPKGVEFKTLEEVFEIKNGYTPSKNNPEFWEKGTIPWFRMEDIRENGRILKDSIQHITPKALKNKKLFPKNSIIISTTATIGEHALLIVDSLANQQFTFLSKKANCNIALDMKFFFYQCFLLGEWCKKNTNVSGFASVDMTAFKKYKFPIPPLEIQQEIVKILDAFTELNTELNTELKARKKQYQYYQNMLLDFNGINSNHQDATMSAKPYPKRLQTLLQTLAPKGVEFKTLEEVFEIKNGYTPSKNNPEFWEKGTIPWFRMEDIRENGRILKDSIQHITPKALKNKKLFPKNSIIISTTATIGEHALLIVDSLANQQFTFLSKKANCNIALDMKFFFYQCFLLGEWCKKNTNVSGFASVDMTAFKKYKFPIPPLEIQQEIVKILDQFLALTTDLLAGIPAEIEARKKQYEYYREKLLTFKPLTLHKEVKKC